VALHEGRRNNCRGGSIFPSVVIDPILSNMVVNVTVEVTVISTSGVDMLEELIGIGDNVSGHPRHGGRHVGIHSGNLNPESPSFPRRVGIMRVHRHRRGQQVNEAEFQRVDGIAAQFGVDFGVSVAAVIAVVNFGGGNATRLRLRLENYRRRNTGPRRKRRKDLPFLFGYQILEISI